MVQQIAVSVSAQKLFEGEVNNPLPQYVIAAIKAGGSIPAAIIRALNEPIGMDMEAFYEYGIVHDKIGVPISFNFSASEAFEDSKITDVREQIAADDSKTVAEIVVKDIEIQFVNPTMLFIEELQSSGSWHNISWEWNEDDGYYEIDRAYWVGTTDQLGNWFDLASGYASGGGIADEISLYRTVTYESPNTVFYHVIYRYTTDPGPTRRVWNYKNESQTGGNYDDLNLDGSLVTGGKYFPVIPIMLNKVWSDQSAYLKDNMHEVDGALKILGLGYDNLKDAISQVDSTDLENIEDVAVLFALDFSASDDTTNMCLFEMFKRYFYTLTGASRLDWYNWDNEISVPNRDTYDRPRNHLEVRSSSINMKMEYQFSKIRVVTGGNIDTDPVPSVSSATDDAWTDPSVENEQVPEENEVVRKYALGTEEETSQSGIYRTDRMVYRKPLASDPSNKYIEILIFGPRMIYDVKREGWGQAAQFYRHMDDWDDGDMLVPISHDICILFPPVIEANIYRASGRLLVTAYEIYDLGFFASNFFNFLFFVFKVIFVFVPGVQQIGQALQVAAAEAAVAGLSFTALDGLRLILKEIIINILVGVAVTAVLVEVINILGIDVGFIIAIAAFASAVYFGNTGDSLFKILNAQDLLFLSDSAFRATDIVIYNDMYDLLEESKEWSREVRERQEEIDKLRAGIEDGRIYFELYELIPPENYNLTDESPSAFYNRTIHQTNPGVLSLDMVSTYSTSALMLPRPDYFS